MAYANDISLLATTKQDLSYLLKTLHKWCTKWKLEINKDKTKIMHFRNVNTPQTNSVFHFCENDDPLSIDEYTYLGIVFNKHLLYNSSAGRAIGAIFTCFKVMKDMGLHAEVPE